MGKKWKKALMAGAAMYGASKLGSSDGFLSSGAAGGANLPKGDAWARAKKLMTSNDAYNGITTGKKSLLKKILNLAPGKNATSKMGGTLAGDYGEAFGDGYSGGAKYGKMIKAKDGVYVTAKCKNGRNKATKIT